MAITEAVAWARNLLVPATNGPPISIPWGGFHAPNANERFEYFARHGYEGNEIVHAAIELLVTSASEPPLVGRRWRRNSPQVRRALENAGLLNEKLTALMGDAKAVRRREREVLDDFAQNVRAQAVARGIPAQYQGAMLVRNGFVEEVTDHPLIRLLNNPNPIQPKALFWSTIFMDRLLAGNAYVLKGRNAFGQAVELWRLRPDRVRIIPDRETSLIAGFEYKVGETTIVYPPNDVIHFRTRSAMSDFYGDPPLMAFIGRMHIEDYMRGFLRSFYSSGGLGFGSVLAVKGKLSDLQKEELRQRLRRLANVPNPTAETLIIDSTEASYTRLGLERGLTDALPKQINDINEARLAMAFGIPGSILGLLIGYESSSYANKRQDWQVLWDVTLSPTLSEYDDALNLQLVPEFAGVDEVAFDLSQIKALQEDTDALHKRARDNFQAGLWSQQEARLVTGVEAEADEEELFMLPSGVIAAKYGDLGEASEPELISPPAPLDNEQVGAAAAMALRQLDAPKAGRRPLADDEGARAIWERAEALRLENRGMTPPQIAARLGIGESTLRRYRRTFGK